VIVFTSSPQSLQGLEIIIDNIRTQHLSLRTEVVPIIPLPSRIDRKEEKGQYDKWFKRVANGKIGSLLAGRSGESIDAKLQKITIEYVPWYTYKDELESDLESAEDVGANAWRFKNLTQLIYEASAQAAGDSLLVMAERVWSRLSEEENQINFNLENLFDLDLGKRWSTKDKRTYSALLNLKDEIDNFI